MCQATRELPITVNTAGYFWEKHSCYDNQAEQKRQDILATADSGLTPTGNGQYYYISYRGNDAADGHTAATAWATANNLKNADIVEEGSVILFERGGVYHGVSLNLPQGVSVGAYGEGVKPCLYAGDKNYADPALWSATEKKNVWSVDVSGALCNSRYLPTDLGNIIFDHGVAVTSPGRRHSLAELRKNYDYYFDLETKTAYVFVNLGNPGEVFSSIEMAPNEHTIMIRTDNHIVENLCIKYSGGHGVSTGGSNNIVVRNCEIGWIGGCICGKVCRYGNGIELYNTTADCVVENNWIYQCFDAGYTHQSGEGLQENIVIKGNLIEYCLYNIEMWSDTGETPEPMRNILIEDNILRFAGFGFGTFNRLPFYTSSVWTSHISMNYNNSDCENTVVKNNVFDTSYRYEVCIYHPNDPNGHGPVITDNTWIQQSFAFPSSDADEIGAAASVGRGEGGTHARKNIPIFGCATQEEMEASVRHFDLHPAAIILDK